jgi:hypothetical protein
MSLLFVNQRQFRAKKLENMRICDSVSGINWPDFDALALRSTVGQSEVQINILIYHSDMLKEYSFWRSVYVF